MKLLEGKTILVTGVTNRWSIATGIASALYAHGAAIELTYQGERVKAEVTNGETAAEVVAADTSRSGFALALDISSFSLIALVAALRDNLNDGASIMALTYYGATAIVPNYNIAGIAKAALESIVRYLAFDLGERGIRVNAISAGPIKTASSRQVAGFSTMLSKVASAAPLRRNVTSTDVGNCAVFLASDLSRAITAGVHFVDAGYHAMGMFPDPAEVKG